MEVGRSDGWAADAIYDWITFSIRINVYSQLTWNNREF